MGRCDRTLSSQRWQTGRQRAGPSGRELVGTRHPETSQRSQQPLTHDSLWAGGRNCPSHPGTCGPALEGRTRPVGNSRVMGPRGHPGEGRRLMSGAGPPRVVRARSGRRPGPQRASLGLPPSSGWSPVLGTRRFRLFPVWGLSCVGGTQMVRGEGPTGSPHTWGRLRPGCPREPAGDLNLGQLCQGYKMGTSTPLSKDHSECQTR